MSEEELLEVGPKAFGRWLETQLQYREWSKADLVRALGTHQGNVTRWIRGDVRVSTRTVDRIADLFNEDVDFLLTLAGHRPIALDRGPDDPRRALHALLDRIDLNEERVWSLRSLLEGYARWPLVQPAGADGRGPVGDQGQPPAIDRAGHDAHARDSATRRDASGR